MYNLNYLWAHKRACPDQKITLCPKHAKILKQSYSLLSGVSFPYNLKGTLLHSCLLYLQTNSQVALLLFLEAPKKLQKSMKTSPKSPSIRTRAQKMVNWLHVCTCNTNLPSTSICTPNDLVSKSSPILPSR